MTAHQGFFLPCGQIAPLSLCWVRAPEDERVRAGKRRVLACPQGKKTRFDAVARAVAAFAPREKRRFDTCLPCSLGRRDRHQPGILAIPLFGYCPTSTTNRYPHAVRHDAFTLATRLS